jgi:hypothetical protein
MAPPGIDAVHGSDRALEGHAGEMVDRVAPLAHQLVSRLHADAGAGGDGGAHAGGYSPAPLHGTPVGQLALA